jgi:hypothetical protein
MATFAQSFLFSLFCIRLARSHPSQICGLLEGNCNDELKTLHEYCGTVETRGKEGMVPSGLKLRHLTVIIRHGDETPPRAPANSTTVIHSHHWGKLAEDPVHYFHLLDGMKSQQVENDVEHPKQPLAPSAFFRPIEENRGVTQLTRRGFMQAVLNGKWLKQSYPAFLDNIRSSKEIFARTTTFNRAIQVFD